MHPLPRSSISLITLCIKEAQFNPCYFFYFSEYYKIRFIFGVYIPYIEILLKK